MEFYGSYTDFQAQIYMYVCSLEILYRQKFEYFKIATNIFHILLFCPKLFK